MVSFFNRDLPMVQSVNDQLKKKMQDDGTTFLRWESGSFP